MIHVRTAKLGLTSGNQDFVQKLYGQWDSFYATSFEKVADDVLSHYDTEDQEIIIESLDLDLGTIEEEEFYVKFPKLFALKLDDIFSSYLRNKDEHRNKIAIIPMRQSRLSGFIYFMTHGWWQWTWETESIRINDLFGELIQSFPGEICRFFWGKGPILAVRKRLVFQFNDTIQERLMGIMIPSDASFVTSYVGLVRRSYPKWERPDIVESDFRNAVWLVVWGYICSESIGHFSRKQMIIHTLGELSAYFNIPARNLLEILTYNLKELSNIRQVMPELLLILEEIRNESRSKTNTTVFPDLLSTEELRVVLSHPESAQAFLSGLVEKEIYRLAERIMPSDHPFVTRYAQALDKGKEIGMLEGKAGQEFRIMKWVFIFEVILREASHTIGHKQFTLSVLKRLASHYNLSTTELLGYFYHVLITSKLMVRPELRELIIALFLDALEESPTSIPLIFPADPAEILSNTKLCHRVLLSLQEEEIHLLVKKVVPRESSFIIQYASALEKGKKQGALEGKAGSEFRLLKWEFIFLVLFNAPVSAFNRKQFTRSVLTHLAFHYNLSAQELLTYFYRGAADKESWMPEMIRETITELYEEMHLEHSKPLSAGYTSQEQMIVLLDRFMIDGHIPQENIEDPMRVFACLLRWAIELYHISFDRKNELLSLLKAIMTNRESAAASSLRMLIIYYMKGQTGSFERQLDRLILPKNNQTPISGKRVRQGSSSTDTPPLPALVYIYNAAFHKVAEGVIRLFRLNNLGIDAEIWQDCLSGLTASNYRNLSQTGLLSVFWQRLRNCLTHSQTQVITNFIIRNKHMLPGLSYLVEYLSQTEELLELEKNCLIIHNAGLVLYAPYLGILFQKMQLLDDSKHFFKDRNCQVKAIFAMQRLASEAESISECELVLNKLVTGYETGEPLPLSYPFQPDDLELISSLTKAILSNWNKMRSTSEKGFRDTFVAREGKLEETEQSWELTISEKAYDVLLDTIPWAFKMIKFAWMPKPIIVKWR